MSHKIKGTVRNSTTNHPIANVKVVAWDYDPKNRDDKIGTAFTDAEGRYQIEYTKHWWDPGVNIPVHRRLPDIYVKAYQQNASGAWIFRKKSSIAFNHNPDKELQVDLLLDVPEANPHAPIVKLWTPKAFPAIANRDHEGCTNKHLQSALDQLYHSTPYAFVLFVKNDPCYRVDRVLLQLFDEYPMDCVELPVYDPAGPGGILFYRDLVNLADLTDRQTDTYEYHFTVKYTDVQSGNQSTVSLIGNKVAISPCEVFCYINSRGTATYTDPATRSTLIPREAATNVYLCSHFPEPTDIVKIERLDSNPMFSLESVPPLPLSVTDHDCLFSESNPYLPRFVIRAGPWGDQYPINITRVQVSLRRNGVDLPPIKLRVWVQPPWAD